MWGEERGVGCEKVGWGNFSEERVGCVFWVWLDVNLLRVKSKDLFFCLYDIYI